ncbi:cation:proton antiporter [Methylocystis parvus]|uniref:cation:proton antiporter domain-containing protein n=1 Tax=Methylocystis parvus TaxID=134 RepID=UPI003B84A587
MRLAVSINFPVYSDALVVLGTAGVVVPMVRYFGLNPVLGYLGAGMLLGPLGLGSFIERLPFLYWITVVDPENMRGIAELGVVFLLFFIGLELSFARLMSMRRLVFGLGGLQFLLTTAALSLIIAATGYTASISLILGAFLALSSTAIVLEILAARGELTSGTGRACFGVLLAQDLAVIPILMFESILGANGAGPLPLTVAKALGDAGAAIAGIVIVGRVVLRPLFRLVGALQSHELLIAAVLFVIIGTGVLAAAAGLSMALGAFVAGLLLAETEYRKALEAIVEPFKGLLLGLFFFTVGMGIDLREIVRDPLAILALVCGLIALKASITAALARAFGQPWRVALQTGLLLGPGSEFAFVADGLAVSLGLIDADLAGFILVVTSLSMALIPPLAHAGDWFASIIDPQSPPHPAPPPPPDGQKRRAIIVGYGRVGKVVTSLFDEHQIPYVGTEIDPELVTQARRSRRDVYYGDARHPAFLKACGLMDASALIVTIGAQATVDAILEGVRQLRPDMLIVARAKDTEHARHLYKIGVTDAVPETVEASLQLAEAALVGLGVPTGKVLASIHEKRDCFRAELREAAEKNISATPTL